MIICSTKFIGSTRIMRNRQQCIAHHNRTEFFNKMYNNNKHNVSNWLMAILSYLLHRAKDFVEPPANLIGDDKIYLTEHGVDRFDLAQSKAPARDKCSGHAHSPQLAAGLRSRLLKQGLRTMWAWTQQQCAVMPGGPPTGCCPPTRSHLAPQWQPGGTCGTLGKA